MINTLKFILTHPLNRGRPISTLVRYASWQLRSRLQDEVVVDWIEGTRLVARNGMTGATGNIYCGLHEFADMAFVLHALGPDDLFVDVGANIGSYSILASGVVGAQSIAIEPDPGTAESLARNVEVNALTDHVEIVRTAVGAEEGEIVFTSGRDTMNRIATSADKDRQVVPLRKLDDILEGKDPVVIKMDVEGFEHEALRGALETLKNPSLVAIQLETVDDESRALIEGAGFQEFSYDPQTRTLHKGPSIGMFNQLFVRGVQELVERLQATPQRRVNRSLI
jgi:FkbM family methyltransferase